MTAYAFDLFGTLIHSVTNSRSLRKLYKADKPQKEIRRILLCSKKDIPGLLKELGLPVELQFEVQEAVRKGMENVVAFPETWEVLTTLRGRGHKIALVSNLAQPFVKPAMKLLPVVFDVTLFSCEVGCAKPDPKIYKLLAEQLEEEPGNILMTGDSARSDYRGAMDAGMQARLIDRSGKRGDIVSLAELL